MMHGHYNGKIVTSPKSVDTLVIFSTFSIKIILFF